MSPETLALLHSPDLPRASDMYPKYYTAIVELHDDHPRDARCSSVLPSHVPSKDSEIGNPVLRPPLTSILSTLQGHSSRRRVRKCWHGESALEVHPKQISRRAQG